jgi:hypothetical protein
MCVEGGFLIKHDTDGTSWSWSKDVYAVGGGNWWKKEQDLALVELLEENLKLWYM